jgi:hypothetical protein
MVNTRTSSIQSKRAGDATDGANLPADHPVRRLAYRGPRNLSDAQLTHRQKILDRIEYVARGQWRWTGQSKTARGGRYPQVAHSLGGGLTQLLNARHVVFYMATGWVHDDVQQYRCRDGDPLNVHPDNIVPLPPVRSARSRNNFWDRDRLREYYG